MKKTLALFLLTVPIHGQTTLSPANQQEYVRALTTNGRFGAPRYTTAGRPACSSVTLGGIIWNTTTTTEQACNGTIWIDVTGPFTSITIGTTTTAGTATCVTDDTMGGASFTDNFFNCTGTFPTTLTATTAGIINSFTTGGSSSQVIYGEFFTLGAGYTGSSITHGVKFTNAVAGTSGSGTGSMQGNIGSHSSSSGADDSTTGTKTGSYADALGSSLLNVGTYTEATQTTPTTGNFGIVAHAENAGGIEVAGLFALQADRLLAAGIYTTSAALILDNTTYSADIFQARDANVLVGVIQDGGSTWEKIGTKALTLGGGAVNFVRVDIASNTYQGGVIYWTADATDATEYQNRSGILPFSIVNKGGTETCTVGTPGTATESVAVSAGTFTVAFTTDTSPTNGCNFAANGTSSLVETVMRLNYHVRLYGNAATAVTAL